MGILATDIMTDEEELIDHEYYLRDLLRDEYAISDDVILILHRYYMPDAKVTRKTIDYKDFAEWIKDNIDEVVHLVSNDALNDWEEAYHLILRQMNRY